MILAWAVILGLILSIIWNGRSAFSQIARIPIRSAWLILAAVVLQLPLVRSGTGPVSEFRFQQTLFLTSFAVLLVFIWINRHIKGVVIIGAGVLLNLVVILANSGFMPISPETLVAINLTTGPNDWQEGFHYGLSKDIILLKEKTNLWFLSDVFLLPLPIPSPAAFSAGDLVIAIGIIYLMITDSGVKNANHEK